MADPNAIPPNDLPPRSRGWLVVLGIVAVGVLLSGTLLRVGSLRGAGFQAAQYSLTFTVHQVAALAAMFTALVHFSPTRARREGLRVFLAGLYGTGLGAWAVSERVEALRIVGAALCLAAVVGFGVLVLDPRTAKGAVFAAATVCHAFLFLDAPFVSGTTLGAASLYVLVAATLVAPALGREGKRRAGPPWIVITEVGAYVASRATVQWVPEARPLVLVEFVAGLVVFGTLLRRSGDEPHPWPRWIRRVEAAFFLVSVLFSSMLGAVTDRYLAETLWSVAGLHVEAAILVLAALRSTRAARTSTWSWVGLATFTGGALAFAFGCAHLGAAGMPRRYMAYLDQFETRHVALSIAAFVLVVGVAIAVVGLVRSRRPSDA